MNITLSRRNNLIGLLTTAMTDRLVREYEGPKEIPAPTPQELLDMIEATDVYKITTNREDIPHGQTLELRGYGNIPNFPDTITLPKAIPIPQSGRVFLDKEENLSLGPPSYSCDADMELHLPWHSKYRQGMNDFDKFRNEKFRKIQAKYTEKLTQLKSLRQLLDAKPAYKKFKVVQEMIEMDQDAKERRKEARQKAKEIERIDIDQAAIAKARLLGAQYVSSN